MAGTMGPEVLADPLGVVVDLVADIESGLDRAAITEVVSRVAGGRAKRRRLAQTLLDRPAVLADGRSPAPRVVADLLVALREAGADRVSPPIWAQCDKRLRTFQRRGEDWYCAVCGPHREPCASCGQTRPVNFRDRDGQPRCGKCPPDGGGDPVDAVRKTVTAIDPGLSDETVAAAVKAAAPQAGQRYQLAWALQDRPDLLTGAGAQAPVPAVLRLIDTLYDAGTQQVKRPACPRCHRIIHLHRRIDEQRLCRNCVAKSRAQPCARCGTVRPQCLITDPANQETCLACGHRRPVTVRTPEGPLCESCRPWKTLTCGICSRTAPRLISQTTGQRWCRACRQRWARCTNCGLVEPVRAGTADAPLCATRARPEPGFWRNCTSCGQPGGLQPGNCTRCTLKQRLRDLLSDHNSEVRPELTALHDNLASYERPTTVLRWLDKSNAPAILRELGTGYRQLTHDALDELPDSKPLRHPRAILVATETLPSRDEHMTRLERWANKQKLTRLDFPATKWDGPTGTLDTEARWEQARRLLHDHTLKPEDRVAGLLVLLYARWPSTISRTLDRAQTSDDQVQLRLGHEPVVLPEPLANLVRQLIATRRGHAAIGDQGNSRWLFPGGQPGHPISAAQLTERLRQLDIHSGRARSTALFALSTELPAALQARMLGIHIAVAVAWQRASSGDWTTYAADVSRRRNT